jgi:hypothetical protein
MDSNEISRDQLNIWIDSAVENYDKVPKTDIYRNIGTSLVAMGLEADNNMENKSLLKESKTFNFKEKPLASTNKFVNTISHEIPAENAEKTGKNFWEIFKKKAKDNICGDKGIIKLLEDGRIKEALEKALPSILIAIGISGFGAPVITVIAIGVLMLLLKAGIESLCEYTK